MKILHFYPSLAGWSLASWCSSSSLRPCGFGLHQFSGILYMFQTTLVLQQFLWIHTKRSESPSWNECIRTEIRREHLCLFIKEEGVRLKAGQQLHSKKNLFTNVPSLCPLIFSLWIWELSMGVFLYILRKYTFKSDALLWDLYPI